MEKLKIINIWDAYCGWCYGFEPILLDFYSKHPELDLEMVSGGLFIGDRAKSAKEMPFIKDANKRIRTFFNISFGEKYNDLMKQGSFIFDSSDPAAVFHAYKQKVSGERLLKLAIKMQYAFFVEGKSLSDAETYLSITKGSELENILNKEVLEDILARQVGSTNDFNRSRELGVTSYPTLMITDGNQIIDLREGAMTSFELEENYINALKRFDNN